MNSVSLYLFLAQNKQPQPWAPPRDVPPLPAAPTTPTLLHPTAGSNLCRSSAGSTTSHARSAFLFLPPIWHLSHSETSHRNRPWPLLTFYAMAPPPGARHLLLAAGVAHSRTTYLFFSESSIHPSSFFWDFNSGSSSSLILISLPTLPYWSQLVYWFQLAAVFKLVYFSVR